MPTKKRKTVKKGKGILGDVAKVVLPIVAKEVAVPLAKKVGQKIRGKGVVLAGVKGSGCNLTGTGKPRKKKSSMKRGYNSRVVTSDGGMKVMRY